MEIIELETELNRKIPVELLRTADTSQALKAFELFKNRFPLFKPELVWEYSAIGNHYQTMLFADDETITVSVCPNHYIPWALRNAVHPREHDFVVIDGLTMSVANVMEIIDEHLENRSIREAIINGAVLKHQLEKITTEENESYQPTEAQIQTAFDHWRLQYGLGSVDAYSEYLQANGLTHEKIEAQIKDKRTYNNFLEAQIKTPLEDYYSQHTAEFARYKLESYIANSQDEADELSLFLQANPDGLCVWARDRFLAEDAEKAQNNYQLNTCWHYQFDPEVAEILSDIPKTGLLSPIEMNGKYTFVNVLAITPPSLDYQTEAVIRQKLVGKWINEKKKNISIQWLWGDKDIFPNQNIQEA